VEVKKTVVSLDIFDTKLNLAVAHGFVVVQISKGELNHTALKVIGGNLGTLGLGDDGFAAVLLGEDGGGNELVPFLLGEGVDGLLLGALLRLRETLVLSLLVEKAKTGLETIENGGRTRRITGGEERDRSFTGDGV
jgi:hypothetical protein